MQTTTSQSQHLDLKHFKVIEFGDKAGRARAQATCKKAFEEGLACATFEAVLGVPGHADVTVTGEWTAFRYDYGTVFFTQTEATKELSKLYPCWEYVVDAVAVYDYVKNAFLGRFPAKAPSR